MFTSRWYQGACCHLSHESVMKWPICWSSPGDRGITYTLQPADTHTYAHKAKPHVGGWHAPYPSLSVCICSFLFLFSFSSSLVSAICFFWSLLLRHSNWQHVTAHNPFCTTPLLLHLKKACCLCLAICNLTPLHKMFTIPSHSLSVVYQKITKNNFPRDQ